MKNNGLSHTTLRPLKMAGNGGWYIKADNVKGRMFVDGPHESKEKAFMVAIDIFNGDTTKFEIIWLDTIDLNSAIRQLKHGRLETKKDNVYTMKRAKRQI